MALFLSTYQNRIDKKGRVSVPAAFRTVLAGQSFAGVVAYGSFVHRCVEACGIDRIEALHDAIDRLDPFSDEHDAFATAILGGSIQLPFDPEGRIMLPADLMDAAGIADVAVFVGKGRTFEIWNPDAHREHAARARDLAREKRLALRSSEGSAA